MRKGFLWVVSLAFCPMLVAQPAQPATAPPAADKPRVFITDSESWEMSGSAAGSNGSFAAQSHGGARPQTAEIIKTFGERCTEVIVNNKQELADYIVVLDHEGGKGYLRHRNKVAVFEHLSGDAVISHSTLSLGGSVEDACNGIVQHWAAHSKEILAAKALPPNAPTSPAPTASVAATAPPPTPVQASVAIESTPPGADIEVDGSFVGNTPSTVTVLPGSHEIIVTKKGFEDWGRKLNVTGGSIHLSADLDPAAPASPAATPK
jgi:hypothetical protein